MKIDFLKHLQKRTEILFFAVVFGVSILLFLVLNNEIFSYLNDRLQHRKNFAEKLFQHNIHKTLQVYDYKIRDMISNSELQEALEREDRSSVMRIVQFLYAQGQRDRLLILTFRKRDGYTLYRAHRPDLYGDYVKDSRRIIHRVNKTQLVEYGFEVGKLEPTFRMVYPIFNQKNRFVGTVEVGFALDGFLVPILELNDLQPHVLIYREHAGAYENSGNLKTIGDFFYLNEQGSLPESIDLSNPGKDQIQKDFDEKIAIYPVVSLYSFDSKTIGFLYVTDSIGPFLEEYYQMLLKIGSFLMFGAILFFLIIQSNLILYRRNIEKSIYRDSLTELPNLNALFHEMKNTDRYAIILADINDFHVVNDVYGGMTGDDMLKNYSALLSRFAADNGLSLFRMTSDEFVFLYPGAVDEEELRILIKMLIDAVDVYSYTLPDKKTVIDLNITVGAAYSSPDALEHAQRSLRKAQKRERPFEIYHEKMDTSSESAEILNARRVIHYSLNHNAVTPYFQPIVGKDGQAIKYEVLMRLFDAEGKMYTPNSFLVTAHRMHLYTSLAVALFQKLKLVCKDYPGTTFSINISASDIYDSKIRRAIEELLELKSNPIIIEIIESENINDVIRMSRFVQSMKEKGARIAIDDFGTGYSNFSHILKLNTDGIKIDGSLIRELKTNTENQMLVKSIVDFANGLGIEVVAEFVETREIYDLLLSYGVDQFQGFHFSKPQASPGATSRSAS